MRVGGSSSWRYASTALAPRDLIAFRALAGRSVATNGGPVISTRTVRSSWARLIVHDQPISVSVPAADGPNAMGWPIRDHFGPLLCPLTAHRRYEPSRRRVGRGEETAAESLAPWRARCLDLDHFFCDPFELDAVWRVSESLLTDEVHQPERDALEDPDDRAGKRCRRLVGVSDISRVREQESHSQPVDP